MSLKVTQLSLQKNIIWTKKSRKTRQEWNDFCIMIGLPSRLFTLIEKHGFSSCSSLTNWYFKTSKCPFWWKAHHMNGHYSFKLSIWLVMTHLITCQMKHLVKLDKNKWYLWWRWPMGFIQIGYLGPHENLNIIWILKNKKNELKNVLCFLYVFNIALLLDFKRKLKMLHIMKIKGLFTLLQKWGAIY